MRCPDCSKFVSFNEPEAEVTGEEVRIVAVGPKCSVNISAEVRVYLSCGDCGTELKETNISVDEDMTTDANGVSLDIREGDELELDEVLTDPIDEGGGRYAKRYYGALVTFRVRHKRGDEWDNEAGIDTAFDLEVEAKEAASYFEEMV